MAPSGGSSVVNGGTLRGTSGGAPNLSSLSVPHVASQAGEVVRGTTNVVGRVGRTIVNTTVDTTTPDQEVTMHHTVQPKDQEATVQRVVRPRRANLTTAAERAKHSLLAADDTRVGRS